MGNFAVQVVATVVLALLFSHLLFLLRDAIEEAIREGEDR